MKKLVLTERQLNSLLLEMTSKEIDVEANKTNTNPTEGQKKAGNYKMGHIRVKGFPITIENPKGSYRKGRDGNGTEWKVLMHDHYGYFALTNGEGKDGDAVDVFIGKDPENFTNVYVVDQKINGVFDESKVMFGYHSKDEAKKAYLSNYSPGWKGFWKITEVTIDYFKKWLYDNKRQRKPFFEYSDIKKG